jgi:large subunit ribosomal protein L19
MANCFKYKKEVLSIGDTITFTYKIKEGDKERLQAFKGILIKIRGEGEKKMITVRKMTRSGIGVERIIPIDSPNLIDIRLDKKSNYRKSKLYFIRNLSDTQLRSKLYQQK